MRGTPFYWGYIKSPDIESVYLQDIFNRRKKIRKHKITTPEYPLAYNEWGKIVRPFGERRGIYHKNLEST